MYGNAAICVILHQKSTPRKKVGGANICAQVGPHGYLARYMRGGKKKSPGNDYVIFDCVIFGMIFQWPTGAVAGRLPANLTCYWFIPLPL
jgi:hypothetical protein